MSDYSAQIASSEATVTRKGAAVTFSRDQGTYTASSGLVSGAPTSASGNAIRVRGAQQRFSGVDFSKLTDPIVLLVAASSLSTFVPKSGDAVTFASVKYRVEAVERVAPNGTPILFYVAGSK